MDICYLSIVETINHRNLVNKSIPYHPLGKIPPIVLNHTQRETKDRYNPCLPKILNRNPHKMNHMGIPESPVTPTTTPGSVIFEEISFDRDIFDWRTRILWRTSSRHAVPTHMVSPSSNEIHLRFGSLFNCFIIVIRRVFEIIFFYLWILQNFYAINIIFPT